MIRDDERAAGEPKKRSIPCFLCKRDLFLTMQDDASLGWVVAQSVFLSPFCQVAKLAIIHKKI
jgi:hypothetical protein